MASYDQGKDRQALGARGVLRFELDRGVPLEPQNPYPSLRVNLAKRVPIFMDFPSKIGLFFKNFPIFGVFPWRKPRKSRNLGLSQKSWPMFKDFLGKKRDPCLRISCKKRPIRAAHPRSAKYVSTPPPGLELTAIYTPRFSLHLKVCIFVHSDICYIRREGTHIESDV